MRLIDADELIAGRVENDPVVIAMKCAPTSYDVNNVLEQLEDATAIGADCVGNAFECIPKYMAIEIVKAGGIYGKAD